MNETMWWVTVVVYWIVVVLCAIAAKRERPDLPWKISAVFFALSAVNKQHDLTGYITRLVRRTASLQDWYDERRAFQWYVIAGICLSAAAILGTTWIWTSKLRWSVSQRVTLIAAAAMLGFALTRAVSLHGIDRLLGSFIFGIKLNWMFELGGLLAVVVTIALSLLGRPRVR